MTNNIIYVVYGCIGEDENFESWEAAAYYDKQLAKSHRDHAEKNLKQIDPEDLPDETPFDSNFTCAHYNLGTYYNDYHPSELISYFICEIHIWKEERLLKAIGESWRGKK